MVFGIVVGARGMGAGFFGLLGARKVVHFTALPGLVDDLITVAVGLGLGLDVFRRAHG